MSEWASHPYPLRYKVAPRAGRDKFWNAERRHRLHHFDSLDGPVFTEAKNFTEAKLFQNVSKTLEMVNQEIHHPAGGQLGPK